MPGTGHQSVASFSPLAGIKFVESGKSYSYKPWREVSVPLRGLSSWKDRQIDLLYAQNNEGFSPLAGIKFVESPPSETDTAGGFYRGLS